MKNLKFSCEVRSEVQLRKEKGEESLRLSAVDIERSRLFFASTSNFIYTTQLITSHQTEGAWNKSSLAASTQLDLETGDFITCLDYLMEKEALIIGTSRGHLLLYSVDDDATEIVGQVEGGVACISPSPDGDLLAILTGFGQILVMNLDWDLLYEMPLDDLPEGVDVPDGSSFSIDCLHEASISWRGDGKFFASLSKAHDSLSLLKKLKVWDRDSGVLHSVSDPKPFMGSVIDWNQIGAKIATVYNHKEEKKCPSIVLYEKNGLERNSFSINDEIDVTVEFLKFNCNSDLLAAIVRGDSVDTLKIWHFSNNRWYMKQEIRFSKEDGIKFMWDMTNPLKLLCWTLDGRIITCKFVWVTAVLGNSVAFVIDGSKVLVTPFSLCLMPPPMYFFDLEFPCAVRDVTFCSRTSQNRLAASLSDGSLCIVELPLLDEWDELEGQTFRVEATYSGINFEPLLHLVWLDSHALLGVSCLDSDHSNFSKKNFLDGDVRPGYYLQGIEIRCSEDRIPGSVTCSGWQAETLHHIYLEGVVVGIVSNPLVRCSAFVQFEGGKTFEYSSKLGLNRGVSLQRRDEMDFLSSCPWIDVAPVGGYTREKPLLLGLDDNGRLHLEGKILCNNCSSFSFYSNSGDGMITHVVISTKQDLLFVVDVGDIVRGELEKNYENFLPVVAKNGKGQDESIFINIWEKGSQIVGVLHGDESAVILQTPRGNLECVYPRKLVLVSIINALANRRFRDALHMVRRHRIDFNIIVDHCGWQEFIGLAADFVLQVGNLNYVTEFVCAIKGEDVMETLYKNYTSLPCIKGDKGFRYGQPKSTNGDNKVSSVLMAIRNALEDQIEETPARELCILTTLARITPPALEDALRRIKVIRQLELSAATDPKRLSYPSSEESLKHLLWLSESEAVFEAALGLYDLNLAAIVALNSQKDPKEFLPLLQELERMPQLLMQYNIDLKLQRYESALRHIVSAGDAYYEDSMKLMSKVPELYPMGLSLIVDPDKRQQVLEAWGDHLNATKCFEDAATTYLCCSCLEKALKAYRAGGNWTGVLTVAGLMKLGEDDLLQLASELSEELQALGKPRDAAKILLDYCCDVYNGVGLLVDARSWEEALRIAFLHRRDDLIKVVKDASLECASVLIGEYNEGVEKVGKYLTRYLAVRQRRLLLAATIKSEERSGGYLDDDTASQASSNFSGMSAYTTGSRRGSSTSTSYSTSTKGRGRQRNRGKIRAGSPDEETALVEHLKGMSLAEGAKCELKSLLICLVILGEEDNARKLQRTAEKFQLTQTAAVKLADDLIPVDNIDEQAFNLDSYIQNVQKEVQNSDAFSWKSKILG
ncbi:LOW QUALITY PROTEIN: elongator complex protein 1 [Salvia miltiorrhiza]|uniref:LOW QUALITY PROTEIN: elongator complex protein 1 n=1 Tax=Salvia miltiorrhiza TaxID=226208 RepID=UPI0025AD3DBC|nr:LOW QUALITY PROTEIN: elongator complex protein 1 [Salvia miltiorrhiza]